MGLTYVACAVLGAFLGRLLTPPSYTAMALLDVQTSGTGQDTVAQVERDQIQLAHNVLSSKTVDAVLSDPGVGGFGYRVDDRSRRWIQQNLEARPYGNSRLVSVMFTSNDPALSVAAVNAAINSVVPSSNQSWPNAGIFVGPAFPPPRKGIFGTITGTAVGLLTAFAAGRWGKKILGREQLGR
jgi:uncharacterized protein involved in exopolysaccharide biosynthesis